MLKKEWLRFIESHVLQKEITQMFTRNFDQWKHEITTRWANQTDAADIIFPEALRSHGLYMTSPTTWVGENWEGPVYVAKSHKLKTRIVFDHETIEEAIQQNINEVIAEIPVEKPLYLLRISRMMDPETLTPMLRFTARIGEVSE